MKIERYFQTPTTRAITELYAWVATEPDGSEGIVVVTLVGGMIMPLVGGDQDRMQSLRGHAEAARRNTGFPIRLVRFGHREVLEELP
jgi:hypothetical protein